MAARPFCRGRPWPVDPVRCRSRTRTTGPVRAAGIPSARVHARWSRCFNMAVVASIASPTLASFGTRDSTSQRLIDFSDASLPPAGAICIAWPVDDLSHDPLRIDLMGDAGGCTMRLVADGLRQPALISVRGASVALDLASRSTRVDRPLDALVGWTVTVTTQSGTFVGVVGWSAPPGPIERCCCFH